MATLMTGKCPHCHKGHMTFSVVAHGPPPHPMSGADYGFLYLRCASCGYPSAALLTRGRHGPKPLDNVVGNPLEHDWAVVKMWPAPAEPDIPEHIPASVKDILIEAEEARSRRSRHAAGSLYGKALDVATKLFDPSTRGSLHQRIERLGKKGKIAPDLANWAMQLKGVRNYTTHEVDALQLDEIEALAETTQLLLRYMFTMPERLKALQQATVAS